MHPDIPQLIKAMEKRESSEAEVLINSISREHWKEYLASTRISDLRRLYDYLAKAEGRKPRGHQFSCMAPLLNVKGERVMNPGDKCELLADYFQEKLTERTNKGLRKGARKGKNQPPGEYREVCNQEHELFREVEVRKAVYAQAGEKATGPDKIPSEVYRNMPVTVSYLCELYLYLSGL